MYLWAGTQVKRVCEGRRSEAERPWYSTLNTALVMDGNTEVKCVGVGRRSEAERPWYFAPRHAAEWHVLK
jgi:hypothetical protein